MTVYTIDPIRDTRWAEFIDRHDSASVFHSLPWLEAIQRTYGYTPVVYTTSPPSSPLSNGIVVCQVRSWLTGRRMVSVPFADHCEPLLDGPSAAVAITEELKKEVDAGKWKYIELRPRMEVPTVDGAVKSPDCYLHMLDLRPAPDELLRRTHKTGVQHSIKRAEREGLAYECGNSEFLLDAFYRLLIKTRRRHQLPPQPIQWFRSLAACMGERLQIRVAFKDGKEIASILTLRHKDVVVYKYGCSDKTFSNLGGTPFLLWKTIMEAKAAGVSCLDFGRSDADNIGLIVFKDRWGAKSSKLTYLRWSRKQVSDAAGRRQSGVIKMLFALMPDAVLQATGRILYRHVG
ncbi:MAG TPA: GNAT family N-acetyltransferase [Candidatus Aquilonibacter sp.]|nr:GNAT family N-acetyltransferase [Candidatus Aquilonibacter sp.]